ncbi:MAG: magnesium-translocating P-type ATPase [Candidatus Diapherotrites archaeon]
MPFKQAFLDFLNSFNNRKRASQKWAFDYINAPAVEVLKNLDSSLQGLSEEQARERIEKYGFNELAKKRKRGILFQLLSKFLNPLIIILLFIATFSFFFGEKVSALLVYAIAFISVFMGFFQEYNASKEVEKLRKMVSTTCTVYRNGKPKEIPLREVVVGDIVDLSAGDIIPADLRIVSSKDLFVNQSSLTGESFPVEKTAAPVSCKNRLSPSELSNIAFMGSSVVSGTALGVVVKTGAFTQFGAISERLASYAVESSFEKGVKKFVWLMIKLMVCLVLVIFAINYFLKGALVESLLFSLAVAVGLTPEALPMLITLNLSKGASAMARKGVIVKRLSSIQTFGAMDILCTDKTGTLTEDKIVLEKHCNVDLEEDESVLNLAYINSYYQTGLKGTLDKAVLKHESISVKNYKKVDEVPFDFNRKIMTVIVEENGKNLLVSKGSTEDIYKRCSKYEKNGKIKPLTSNLLQKLRNEYLKLNEQGFRVIAVAYKRTPKSKKTYSRADECGLILKGYLAFLDPPKGTAKKSISLLKKNGITLKVLTGDNEILTASVCKAVGIEVKKIVIGADIDMMSDAELGRIAEEASVFARLNPFHKERIINVLKNKGHTVGFLGDGINDALALKAADIGISVNNAVDIAKESADIILLKRNLDVLAGGVQEGRKTFGNILKYVKMSASSNFGNMFSMTGASLFLPFLPMLPIQILLNNFFYDISQIAVPSDEVDEEYLLKERLWNVEYIKKFVLVIGPISSIFDFMTFAVMWFVFGGHLQTPEAIALFHTGWFLESLCTQTLVVHIIRTGKTPFIESKPSQFLVFMSIYITTIALILPFTPLGPYFGFVMPPLTYFLFLAGITASYLMLVQRVKSWFIKKHGYE